MHRIKAIQNNILYSFGYVHYGALITDESGKRIRPVWVAHWKHAGQGSRVQTHPRSKVFKLLESGVRLQRFIKLKYHVVSSCCMTSIVKAIIIDHRCGRGITPNRPGLDSRSGQFSWLRFFPGFSSTVR